MSSPLANARCFKHVHREAVARCPECGKFYCRECVTEHEGRMMCRSCLDALLQVDEKVASGWFQVLKGWLLAGAGVCLVAYVFFQLGRFLLSIPAKFHSGIFFE
ncbi:MAG: rhomboid family protein [Coraliomargarita sp.]